MYNLQKINDPRPQNAAVKEPSFILSWGGELLFFVDIRT